jgi:hypothetical protein
MLMILPWKRPQPFKQRLYGSTLHASRTINPPRIKIGAAGQEDDFHIKKTGPVAGAGFQGPSEGSDLSFGLLDPCLRG